MPRLLPVALFLVAATASARAEGESEPVARARALTERVKGVRELLADLDGRLGALEKAMAREEQGDLEEEAPRRRPAPPVAPVPATEPQTGPGEPQEGPVEETPPDEQPPAPEEDGVDPAVREVAGVYDLDMEAFLEAMEAAMREQLASSAQDVPREFVENILETFRERLREFRFTLTLDVDGTWSAEGVMEGEEESARGTWVRDGETVTLTQTHKNDEELDEPETLEGTWEDGTLRLQPSEAVVPFPLVLVKRAS